MSQAQKKIQKKELTPQEIQIIDIKAMIDLCFKRLNLCERMIFNKPEDRPFRNINFG